MQNEIDPEEHRRQVAAGFNLVAGSYDREALRFFPFCADRLIALVKPRPGEKVLDVATGTGQVAIAAAHAVGPSGRVIGIDIAEEMLAQAQRNIARSALNNVDLHVMNAGALEFRPGYFNHVVCSFGLFFLPDMQAAVREWAGAIKPGGRIAFTAFGPNAFQPMMRLFLERLAEYGIGPSGSRIAAERLADPEVCRGLLVGAGLDDVEVRTEQMGYHLRNTGEWWEVLWHSGARVLLSQLPADRLDEFKTRHLAEIARLVSEQGLWLDIETHFALGRK